MAKVIEMKLRKPEYVFPEFSSKVLKCGMWFVVLGVFLFYYAIVTAQRDAK